MNKEKNKPNLKLLLSEAKASSEYHLERKELANKDIVYTVTIMPKAFSEEEVEVKNNDFKDLKNLIDLGFKQLNTKIDTEINGIKTEMRSNYQELKSELQEHIAEFKEFKSDMLSLPTILRELKNR